MIPTLSDLTRDLRDLPPLPAVVLDALRSLDDPLADVGQLAASLARDQAIAVKTLRLANSSFYGLSRQVSSVPQAITVLGLNCVRTLVAAIAIIDHFGDGQDGAFDRKGFWRHALATALCARSLARHARLQPDFAFVAGLLLDVGQLALALRYPGAYAAVRARQGADDSDLCAAEHAVLGFDHTQSGRLLAEQWKFPPLLQRAIGNHHAPQPADLGGLACVAHLADVLVHALDLPQRDAARVPTLSDAAWDSLALGRDAILQVCADTCAQYDETCTALGL